MDKREGDQSTPQTPDQTAGEPAKLAAPPAAAEAAAPEPAKAEAQAVTPLMPQPEPQPVVAVASVETSETAPIVISIAPPKAETAVVEPVMRTNDLAADVRVDETNPPAAGPSLLSGWTTSPAWARARRLAPLAATIVIALALGAAAGSFATGGGGSAPTSPPAAQTADARALKEQIARLHGDIAALKASIDTSAKTASAQYIRLGDRLDRFEKTQAEPGAKIAKLAEAVDRLERRTASVAAAAQDVTGSVGPVASLAPAPQLAGPPETRPAALPVLEGWRVRSVYNGAALIQSRFGGVMEVEPGDNVPGLGHVETIRRQDGKWVVVTNKGLIVAR